jgi:hypothetical protein
MPKRTNSRASNDAIIIPFPDRHQIDDPGPGPAAPAVELEAVAA